MPVRPRKCGTAGTGPDVSRRLTPLSRAGAWHPVPGGPLSHTPEPSGASACSIMASTCAISFLDKRNGPAGSLPGRYFCSETGNPKPTREASRHKLGSFPLKTRLVSELPHQPLPGRPGGRNGPPRVASSLLLPPPQPEAPPLPRPRSPRGLSPRSGELPATERPKAQNTSSGAKLLAVSLPLVWLGDVAWPSELRTPLPFPPKAPLTTTGAGGPVSTIGC